jgi:dihydrofolate reductase
MIATILVAYDEGRVIGNSHTNDLPWRIPEDLRLFKERTVGHPVIMGYKTYQSIPEKNRPLPGRDNIVVTRNPIKRRAEDFPNQKVFYVASIEEALDVARPTAKMFNIDECFIIGGASIYQAALDANLVDRILVHKIKGSYYGDVFFPYLEPAWKAQIVERRNQFDVWEYRKYPRD